MKKNEKNQNTNQNDWKTKLKTETSKFKMVLLTNSIILSDTDRECNSRDSGRPKSSNSSPEKEKISELENAKTEIELLRSQLEAERKMKNQIAEVLTFETGLRRYTNKGWFHSLSQEIIKQYFGNLICCS